MSLTKYANSYRAVAVGTASPGQLILMLFDGSLRFLTVAQSGFALEAVATRHEQIHNNLVKAQRILRELQGSLDLKYGGEFAERMHALYDFMFGQLQQANLRKAPEPIAVVQELLSELREAWSEMLQQSICQAA